VHLYNVSAVPFLHDINWVHWALCDAVVAVYCWTGNFLLMVLP